MKLCHKCSGTFEIIDGLNSCQCISGYPRGFELNLTLEQAATAQAKQEIEWIALHVSQGRSIEQSYDALSRLAKAMKSSPLFEHGTIKWEELGKDLPTTTAG